MLFGGLSERKWIKNADGTHRMAIAHILDITKRKLAESALMESEARMRFALEGSNDGIWDLNLQTGELYLSPRGCEILGHEFNEIGRIVKKWDDLVHPDDQPKTKARLQAHLEGNTHDI